MAGDIFTAGSAFLAALTGLYSAYQLKSSGRDRIRVAMWGVGFDIDEITKMHVVNLRDHRTVVADWGYIDERGVLNSIPVALEFANRDEGDVSGQGSATLENKADIFEHGTIHAPTTIIGAYAITATQIYPRFCIKPTMPIKARLAYRLKVYRIMWGYFWQGDVMYVGRKDDSTTD